MILMRLSSNYVFDEDKQTLIVYTKNRLTPRGKIVLFHGGISDTAELGSVFSFLPPGIWSIAGTAERLAKIGYNVFIPEIKPASGYWGGDWVDYTKDWIGYGSELTNLVGYSFGASSLIEFTNYLQKHKSALRPTFNIHKLVMLDPALASVNTKKELQQLNSSFHVLFSSNYVTKGRYLFKDHPRGVATTIENTKHRHFSIPFGVVGKVYHAFTPGVRRAQKALETMLENKD